jgi:hypothetical protein
LLINQYIRSRITGLRQATVVSLSNSLNISQPMIYQMKANYNSEHSNLNLHLCMRHLLAGPSLWGDGVGGSGVG